MEASVVQIYFIFKLQEESEMYSDHKQKKSKILVYMYLP